MSNTAKGAFIDAVFAYDKKTKQKRVPVANYLYGHDIDAEFKRCQSDAEQGDPIAKEIMAKVALKVLSS